jgi:POT family proton-dependent oligopeptide transporter
MGTGMFFCAFSFLIVAWIENQLVQGAKMGVLWQSWPYLVLTIGEVLVSNTALEFAFREAPVSMRSTLMSFWLLTIAIGNLAVSRFFGLNVKSVLPNGTEELYINGTGQFILFAALLGVVSVGFVWIASRYKYRDPSQLNG